MKTKLYLSNTGHTFVKAQILLKEKTMDGYFLIDSGSTDNYLDPKHITEHDLDFNTEQRKTVTLLDEGKQENVLTGDTQLKIGDKCMTLKFNLMKSTHPMINAFECRILGILGNYFLVKNSIILDYENQNILTPEEDDIQNAYEIRSQFRTGFNLFGVPAIGLLGEDQENIIMAVLDTGSGNNVICRRSLDKYGIIHSGNDSQYNVYGAKAETCCHACNCTVKALSQDNRKQTCLVEFSDNFLLLEEREYIVDGEQGKIIEAIIGGGFLSRHGAVLDFSTGDLYLKEWKTECKTNGK